MPDPRAENVVEATFVAVVGPSGAGKDTILAIARDRLGDGDRFRFARRVITRKPQPGSEDHDWLSPQDFAGAEKAGAFCLSWEAHGLSYGLPAENLSACRAGCIVVANVSRQALVSALRTFGALHVAEITAPRELLVQRIADRGRESPSAIDARLRRQVELAIPTGAHGPHRIDNSGTAEQAAEAFIAYLTSLAGTSRISA